MSDDKDNGFIQCANELDEFIKLTSGKIIRLAAYPDVEWVENGGRPTPTIAGGLLGSNYDARHYSDKPPVIESSSRNTFKSLLGQPNCISVEQNLDKRKANIAAHWVKVKAHPCYKKFHSYANNRLDKAVKVFENKAKRNDALDELKSDLALFRFYHLFAQYIEAYLLYEKFGYRSKYADAKVLNRAKGHVEKLQADFRDGLRLGNNHQQLKALLTQLLIEIDTAPRKDNETLTAAKRRALESFAYISILKFGEASATILGHFAEILGWDNCSSSTMDKIVATAKEKNHQFAEKIEKEKAKKETASKLAEALRQPPL